MHVSAAGGMNSTPALDKSKLERSSIVPFRERITCTVPEACQAVGLGRSKLYELITEGRLRTMTIGRRRLVDVQSLLTLVSAE
jgi:excisionase family DNA binding protein